MMRSRQFRSGDGCSKSKYAVVCRRIPVLALGKASSDAGTASRKEDCCSFTEGNVAAKNGSVHEIFFGIDLFTEFFSDGRKNIFLSVENFFIPVTLLR